MPVTPTYPGVYIQELPSAVHTITGVATSITAFVGYTASGIDDRAEQIFSFGDYQRLFGGLASNSELSYAVQQFFANGGTQGYVVRVGMHNATFAQVVFGGLTLNALSSGAWANGQIYIDVDVNGLGTTLATDPLAFNLTVTNLVDGTIETFPSVSLNSNQSNYVWAVVNDPDNGSQLVNINPAPATLTTPLVVTGVLGTNLVTVAGGQPTVSGVNTALGVTAANPTLGNSVNFGVSFTVVDPAPATFPQLPINVTVFPASTAIPQTVAGLAAQLQKTLNAALAVKFPGASVQCSAAGNGNNLAICVNALIPQYPDAVVSIAAPTTAGLSDASAALGLSTPASVNVAHYTLGTGNGPAANGWQGSQISSTPASDGTRKRSTPDG